MNQFIIRALVMIVTLGLTAGLVWFVGPFDISFENSVAVTVSFYIIHGMYDTLEEIFGT